MRTTRRVELTDAGKALLPEARRTLVAADAARAGVRAVTGLLAGRVTVGTGKALHIDVAGGLERFSAEHPGVDVDLHQGGSIELLEAVGDGRLDFAPLGLVDELPRRRLGHPDRQRPSLRRARPVGVAVPRGRPPSPAARALFEALLPGVEWPG